MSGADEQKTDWSAVLAWLKQRCDVPPVGARVRCNSTAGIGVVEAYEFEAWRGRLLFRQDDGAGYWLEPYQVTEGAAP